MNHAGYDIVTADFNAGFGKCFGQGRQYCRKDRFMDQDCFGSIADRNILCFAVQCYFYSKNRICGFIDIDVTNAVRMTEDCLL